MNIVINVILWIAYAFSLYFSVFLLLVFLDKKRLFDEEKSSLSLKKFPLVTVIVPAYNEEKTILKTLESIDNLNYPKDKLEVIVVNDGSRDNTEKIVNEYIKDKSHFQLLSHSNRGKAASMNRALSLAKGEYFACLDADSFVHPDTLRKMMHMYEKDPDPNLAIITPAMKVHSPKNLLQRVQWLEYIVIILIARISSHLDCLYVAPGPFSVYRTAAIKKLGGFSEGHITEDQEIAYRAQKHHYRIKQCPDGYVYTTAPREIGPFYRQRRRWYLGSMICVYQYKELVGNKKYGDFGLMQMIKNVLGFILAVTGVTLSAYFLLRPLFRWIKNMILVKTDLWGYLMNLKFRFSFLDLLLTDFRKGFIIAFLFVIGMLFFYWAHKNAQEKILRFGWIPLIPYFIFYYTLKGLILLLCTIEFARGKKIKW
jgi:cellulose synthase/poly-beta-1,6-N-acetylglucosamine synthase-like glycosyltransferase